VKASPVVAVEQAENAVVKLDDLSTLPMTPRIVRGRCRVPWAGDLVGHIDPESAQEMRAQRRAAGMHAQHENDRPTLHLARNGRDPVTP